MTVFSGKTLEGAEVLELRGAYIGQDADGGLCHLTKLAHFAGVVAPKFKHGVFVPFFQATERKGQAKRVFASF